MLIFIDNILMFSSNVVSYSSDDLESSDELNPDCGHWEWQQRTRYVSVNYPSDGLLPKYTQVMDNVSSGNVYRIDNANHTEVRNMSAGSTDETKDQFDLIFNRSGNNDFFKTPRR